MSWLSDIKYKFKYKCADGHITKLELKSSSDDMEAKKVACEYCNKPAAYTGFDPITLRQEHNVEYDQNGRRAVRTRNKDGSITHLSKTKLHYMKTGRIENQYTDSYKKKLMRENQEQLLHTDYSRRRAKASRAKYKNEFNNKLESLPDGEYVTDGDSLIMEAPK